jgi:rfaE bifunctional protein kinase chain/domain
MNSPIDRTRLEQILNKIKELRIGVLGDFILDGYWYADMERSQLSRETATFPRPITREMYSLGGAANVAWNLSALGVAGVCGFSVIGDDWRGNILRSLLVKANVQTSGIFNQLNRQTPFYGKVMLTAVGRRLQEDARLDFINDQPIASEMEDALLEALDASLEKLDGVIIADYQPTGILSARVTAGILKFAKLQPKKPFVVDSRERAGEFRALILKPNETEAAQLFFPERKSEEITLLDLSKAAVFHSQNTGRAIIVTRGEQGCLVADGGECVSLPGVHVPAPVDPVGAGDSFLASFTAASASGATPLEAACLANLSAAVTVTKIGITGTACPAEILAAYDVWASALSE